MVERHTESCGRRTARSGGYCWPAEAHPPVQQQPSSECGVPDGSSEGESDARAEDTRHIAWT